jgi:hypothetical protein
MPADDASSGLASRKRSAYGSWHDMPPWHELSITVQGNYVRRVQEIVEGCGPAQIHTRWLQEVRRDRWRHGPGYDASKREHPAIVPYDELPRVQRRELEICVAIALTMARATGLVDPTEPDAP